MASEIDMSKLIAGMAESFAEVARNLQKAGRAFAEAHQRAIADYKQKLNQRPAGDTEETGRG